MDYRRITMPTSPRFLRQVEVGGGRDFDIPTDFCVCRVKTEFVEPSSSSSAAAASVDASCRRLFSLNVCSWLCMDETSSVRLGEGCSSADVVLERCLKTMSAGETCLLNFLVTMDDEDDVSEPFDLKLRLTLEGFDQPSPASLWEMSSDELLTEALHLKSRGVQLYVDASRAKTKRTRWAFRLFSRAAKLLIAVESSSNARVIALVQCYSNMAACQLLDVSNSTNVEYAIVNCDKALALDADNVKCLYRRAVASIALQRYEIADADLDGVLKLDPFNSAAIRQKKILRAKFVAHEKSFGGALRKMFK